MIKSVRRKIKMSNNIPYRQTTSLNITKYGLNGVIVNMNNTIYI